MRTIPSLHGRAIGATAAAVALAAAALMPSVVAAKAPPFLTSLPTQTVIGSTVPGNGDINPYGIAVVPRTMGHLVSNDVLISNFNASSNLQGTGSTIVEVAPNGTLSVFATVMASDAPSCTGGVGLTTALVVLRSGWVIVGSLPTTDGTSATAKAGCLIVLNSWGHVVETFQGSMINGPWDMTAVDRGGHAILFVSNVLNGTVAAGGSVVNGGTVVRIGIATRSKMPKVTSEKVIGWGFPEKTDPAALVIGPTGLAFNSHGNLFVADTIDNRIAVISDADDRRSSSHLGKTVMVNNSLNQPLGLAMAPNGDVLAVNAGDGNAVELTTSGVQVAVRLLESAGGGTLFGLALSPHGHGLYFVDDGFNTLQLLH